VDRFEYLARFHSQAIMKEWCCRKFEGGLRHELCRFLVPLQIRKFPVLVEQARTVEKLEIGPSRGSGLYCMLHYLGMYEICAILKIFNCMIKLCG